MAAAFIIFTTAAILVFKEEDFAIDLARAAASIGFIGIDVHGKGELWRDADDGVAEDGFSFWSSDADIDDVAIIDAEGFRIFWGHVDMTLGDDDAFLEFKFTAILGVDQGDGGAIGHVAGKADRGFEAEGAGVGGGHLDLVEVP